MDGAWVVRFRSRQRTRAPPNPFGHSISFLSLGYLDHSIGLPRPVPEPEHAINLHSGEVLSFCGFQGYSYGGNGGGYSVMFTCRVEVRLA